MSSTEVYGLTLGKGFEVIASLRNSWLSAPLVWEAIAKTYTGQDSYPVGDLTEFWRLHKSPSLSSVDRSMFLMTFDRAYVAKRDYRRAADDIAAFMKAHSLCGHWLAIRDIFLANHDYDAIGFRFTTVSENPFLGEWSDELDDYEPFDWDTAWSVYDYAQGIETGTAETPQEVPSEG